MRKKIFFGVLLLALVTSLIGANVKLSAAGNRVEIKTRNEAVKQISDDGATLTNIINETKTNLEEGTVFVDVTISNRIAPTEIIYAVDSVIKSDSENKIATAAKSFETTNGTLVKQGLIYFDEEVIYEPLENNKIEDYLTEAASHSNIDKVSSTSINSVVSKYSQDTDKVLVMFVSTLSTDEELEAINTLITSNTDLTVVVYSVGLDSASINTLREKLNNATIHTIDSINNLSSINIGNVATISEKNNVNTRISFDKAVYESFNIKDVTSTKGTITYDDATKTINLPNLNIDANEVVVVSYTLQLKTDVNPIYVGQALRTSRQVLLSGDIQAELPETNKIEDGGCSPEIIILEEAVTNPRTGVAEYLIAGSCMLAVALITLVIMNNKKEFNRI